MRNEPDLQITTKVNVIYFFNDIEKRWNVGLLNALMNEGYTFRNSLICSLQLKQGCRHPFHKNAIILLLTFMCLKQFVQS